jgi:3-phosphoshikimate 1-carboxyvinyltransferase
LGVSVEADRGRSRVVIVAKECLRASRRALDMKESGTSARLFLGLLAGQSFASIVTGASSLTRRPMARVLKPLRRMGADFRARRKGAEEFLPIHVSGQALRGISWTQEVASAQVKSAVLLAGCFAKGKTTVVEPVPTRDHTERMMRMFGARIRVAKNRIELAPCPLKSPGTIQIPGDISSAAFFIVAALIVKGSRIVLQRVGVNPTRLGLVNVLKRMGASIHMCRQGKACEPIADIEVVASALRATRVRAGEIPSLIDELPILMVAAGRARGVTVIEGVGELRVKETDRIRSMVAGLRSLGVPVSLRSKAGQECLEITGVDHFPGAHFSSFGDHRTAMCLYVAALAAEGVSRLDDTLCIHKSFPGFLKAMKYLVVR